MRTLMKILIPVEAGSKALQDGNLPKLIAEITEQIKPEAAYFFPTEGKRSCFMVFDLNDSSDLPAITESVFQHLQAHIEITPCMNLEDLQNGMMKMSHH